MGGCSKVFAAAALSAGVLAAPAAGASPPITGKVSKPGYTVIALAASGKATSAAASPSFKLRAPAAKFTLQLRDRSGRYAGPVVVGGGGRSVVMGVKGGARVGRIVIRRGYGRARVPRRFLIRGVRARARHGTPIGAGRLGRVRTRKPGRAGRGRDGDHDGIPGAFDVDDDGDLRLDNVDRAYGRANRRVSEAATSTADPYRAFWVVNAGLQISCISDQAGYTKGLCGYALNQNAAGPFAESAEFEKLIDLLMQQRGTLFFPLPSAGTAELDCGGLSYCSTGGTGFFHTRSDKFPEAFDPDGDGFGTMAPVPAFHEGQDGLGTLQSVDPKSVFGLAPMAGASALRSGDTYIERLEENGAETQQPVTLNTVFGTLPALSRWSDGSRSVDIRYPVPTGAEGAENNGFTVQPAADGHYRVKLTIWRPQRKSIPSSGEGNGWIDMGGLRYTVVGKTAEENRRVWQCPASAYSTSDPNLTETSGGLLDAARDEPISPSNTLTFTVDITDCLTSSGIAGFTKTSTVFVTALSAYGDAAEGVGFSFKPGTPGGASSSAFGGSWRFPGGAPGAQIDWTVSANSASTSRFQIIVYNPYHVAAGTPPPGWTCTVGRVSRDNDAYDCTGATLQPGESASGSITLDQAGRDGMAVDAAACQSNGVCQGYGLTQQR